MAGQQSGWTAAVNKEFWLEYEPVGLLSVCCVVREVYWNERERKTGYKSAMRYMRE